MAMTDRDVVKMLLDYLEETLRDEFSSDGCEQTAFARGWLGIPLPENSRESPHRLTKHHAAGVEARKKDEDENHGWH